MWPLMPHSRQLIAMTVNPHMLAISWFSLETQKKQPRIQLNAFTLNPLENLEFVDGLIFNPTAINEQLKKFIQNNRLSAPAITCAISGPGIQEKIVTVPTAKPSEKSFTLTLENANMWDYIYLHPNDGNFSYYVCGITRKQLAQHTAFAATYGHNITMITTASAALLGLYRHAHGAAFRYSQLAHDLAACNNTIENLNSVQWAKHAIKIIPTMTDSELAHIMPGLGTAYTFFKEKP